MARIHLTTLALWVLVLQLGIVNATFVGAFTVLGPALAKTQLGGAGLILSAQSIGAVPGAILMFHYRPSRLLQSGSHALPMLALPLLALAANFAVVLIVDRRTPRRSRHRDLRHQLEHRPARINPAKHACTCRRV